jgi:tetratricopeptide (TPR) repeat protein
MLLALLALCAGASASTLFAQNQDQNQDQGQDQEQKRQLPKSSKKSPGIDVRSDPEPPPQDDPGKVAYLAQKDIEVGTFYLHKGDTDAAIDRFRHATETRPTLSKPYELLGEAYEKKDDKEEALKAYHQYLKIQPGAFDAKKVQRKITKLQTDLAH